MTQPSTREIIKQVEFYFSDANIVRDTFLQTVMKENEGYVPISVLNSFNRMKKFGVSSEALQEVLQGVAGLEVAAGKVKRTAPIPKIEEHNAAAKTLLVKNFPAGMTLEEVEQVFAPYAEKVARITMRKDHLKTFRGSIYLELVSEADLPFFQSLSLKVPATAKDAPEAAGDENAVKRQKLCPEVELSIVPAEECLLDRKLDRLRNKEAKNQAVQRELREKFANKVFNFSVAPGPGAPGDAATGAQPLSVAEVKAALPEAVFVDLALSRVRIKEAKERLPATTVGASVLTFSSLTEEELEQHCQELTLTKNGKISRAKGRK